MKRTNSPDKNKRLLTHVVILATAIIAALALALTFALGFDGARRVSVDSAQQGEIKTSATVRKPTSKKLTDYSTTALEQDDTFEFPYAASNYYGITLPAGKYSFELWGAEGGNSGSNMSLGGFGGYVKTIYRLSQACTFYIYVGNKGVTAANTANSTAAAGYNGGGNSRNGRTCGHRSGSGGGATHVALKTGLLKTFSTDPDQVLMVAGGGGGGGYGVATANGGNAGPKGQDATYSDEYTNVAQGGTTTAGGECLAGDTPWANFKTVGKVGTFGLGGNGGARLATLNSDGAVTTAGGAGGGGGGGGYYGGAGGYTTASCQGAPGGGGSNYIKTSGITGVTVTTVTNGTNTRERDASVSTTLTPQAGKALVTVLNQEPVTLNYSTTLKNRGANTATTISASQIAKDPDGTATAVYLTNGTAGAYDNFTANSGLWLDANCTTSASKYFSWTTTSNTSFSIKATKYPRAGQTGVIATSSTAGNTVRLYTKIRDAYGTTATRGVSTISFNVTVPKDTAPTKNSTVNATNVSATGASSTVSCLYGNSNYATAHPNPESATASTIYNPKGTGNATLFIKKTLMLGAKITINAADLLSGVLTSFDQAVISIPDLTSISGAARKFKVSQVDNASSPDRVTAYSTSYGTIANTFSKITLECVAPDTAYQVLPVTVYVVEKSACTGSSNVALWDSTSGLYLSYSFHIVFKMENTRPVLKSGVNNVVNIGVGTTTSLALGTYFSDVDNPTGITASTHTITGVTVPTNEFIALNKVQAVVTQASPNANYYNKGTATTDTFTKTAQSNMATGFKTNIAYANASPAAGTNTREAFISYTYSGATLSVTGLRASFSQYSSTRADAPGHFYLLLHISDTCDTSDQGIWLPIAFTVGNEANTSHAPVATV
ncbi:MAG: hypothetical protein K2L88_03780, partial [Clostridiales bacterium]|nr:hypothetical protein [Clostridiales bacterium]